jgi:hypothetical protein
LRAGIGIERQREAVIGHAVRQALCRREGLERLRLIGIGERRDLRDDRLNLRAVGRLCARGLGARVGMLRLDEGL